MQWAIHDTTEKDKNTCKIVGLRVFFRTAEFLLFVPAFPLSPTLIITVTTNNSITIITIIIAMVRLIIVIISVVTNNVLDKYRAMKKWNEHLKSKKPEVMHGLKGMTLIFKTCLIYSISPLNWDSEPSG